jgi:hypothetical protein
MTDREYRKPIQTPPNVSTKRPSLVELLTGIEKPIWAISETKGTSSRQEKLLTNSIEPEFIESSARAGKSICAKDFTDKEKPNVATSTNGNKDTDSARDRPGKGTIGPSLEEPCNNVEDPIHEA